MSKSKIFSTFQTGNLNTRKKIIFLILIFLQHNLIDLLTFKFIQSNSESLKYNEFSSPGCKDVFIRNL